MDFLVLKRGCVSVKHYLQKSNFTPDNNTFKSIIVDFKLGNKIVEFDGTHWHKNRTALDAERDNYLHTRGYDIMRVSELDYKTNGVSCIDSIVNFLTSK